MEKIQNGMTKCECGSDLIFKEFNFYIIYYCGSCSFFKSVSKECNHKKDEKIPIKFKIENGSYQIRLYCPVCKILEPTAQKHAGYNLNKIKESTLESFRNYIDGINKEEIPEYNNIMDMLRQRQYKTTKDIYNNYIKSDAWKEKRFTVLRRDNNKCQICNSIASDVHHLTYIHLQNEYLFELVSLCRNCHIEKYHKDKADFDY